MDANTTRLAEIRQRAEAVGLSPEPWKAIFGSWTVYSNYNTDDQAIVADVYERVDDGSANTIYIACARSDIPYLLDLIQELQAENTAQEYTEAEGDNMADEVVRQFDEIIADKDAEIERLRSELFVYANRGSWTHEAGLRNDKKRDDIWIFDEPGYVSAETALNAPKPGSYKSARGALPWKDGDEPAEETISKLRGGKS